MRGTKITPLPTECEIRRLVDALITPELADEQAAVFGKLMLMVASPEDEQTWHLANVAARHAFAKTMAFDEQFREFTGDASHRNFQPKQEVIELCSQQ